jgi:hypothetical protein
MNVCFSGSIGVAGMSAATLPSCWEQVAQPGKGLGRQLPAVYISGCLLWPDAIRRRAKPACCGSLVLVATVTAHRVRNFAYFDCRQVRFSIHTSRARAPLTKWLVKYLIMLRWELQALAQDVAQP